MMLHGFTSFVNQSWFVFLHYHRNSTIQASFYEINLDSYQNPRRQIATTSRNRAQTHWKMRQNLPVATQLARIGRNPICFFWNSCSWIRELFAYVLCICYDLAFFSSELFCYERVNENNLMKSGFVDTWWIMVFDLRSFEIFCYAVKKGTSIPHSELKLGLYRMLFNVFKLTWNSIEML